MGRKIRTSEYQRAFQGPSKEYYRTVHEELCAYRHERRQQESVHEKLKWESSDSSGSDNSGKSSPIPAAQNLTQELKVTSPAAKVQQNDREEITAPFERSNEVEIPTPTVREVKDQSEMKNFGKRKAEPKLLEYDIIEEKPPFVTYGWADRELTTACKLTHNVKANREYVYPSALKKLKLLEKKRKHQDDARAESRASVAAALQNKQKALVSNIWMTEYQRCFSRPSIPQQTTEINHASSQRRPPKSKRPQTR